MFVLDVFPEGAAGKDGRLQRGDQILSLGNESFKQIESHKAREAMLKLTSGTVRDICIPKINPSLLLMENVKEKISASAISRSNFFSELN